MKNSIIYLLFLIGFSSFANESLQFEKLLVNGMENPMDIETKRPLFSWVVDAEGYNKSQTAYHIKVASTKEGLANGNPDVWDSGKVMSSTSIHVKYEGQKLKAMNEYFWQVQIWDEQGNASSKSKPHMFRMGLMGEENWGNAKFIMLGKDTRTSPHKFREYLTSRMQAPVMVDGFAASYFRKKEKLSKDIVSAQAYVVGLGYYELFINDEKVGDHVLDPAPSNYDKQAYYVSYDVTENLKKGKNVFGITLGNGFYGQNISWKNDPESERDLAFGPPSIRLLILIKDKNGNEQIVCTNSSWKESTGPIVFNNIYGGDTYDARFELGDWKGQGFDDSKWNNAKETQPNISKVSHQNIPAIKSLKTLEAKKIFQAPDKSWIVDFGQNIAGWVKLQVQESEGKLIEITNTEALLTNETDIYQGSTGGGANGMPQIYKYICKSDQLESWEPSFSYHGFRYAKIKGLSAKPTRETLKAVLVATDIKNTGSFTSSDELFNKMHSISKWTVETNIHGIPEDCPHREKCGWLGDAHAFCEYALYNYDMYTFYKKYMEDIRTQMRAVPGDKNTDVKFMVPTMIAPGKRTSTIAKLDWGVATMYLPWYNYLYYGDSTIVQEYYTEMKNLTEYYLSFKDENGIIQNGMGDWCPPRWDRRKNPSAMECDPIISANAYFFDILGIMKKFARMNNDPIFEKEMDKEQEALKKAFANSYLKPISGTQHKWYESQTATIQALQFGLVPENDVESVLNGLVYDILKVKKGHHSTGIHGNRYLYTVLSKYGKADLAYDLLTIPTFPSQTYVMNSGFTTWPERQFEWEKMKGPTNSLNHPMHSGFAAYFFETLGGVKPTYEAPGFKEFSVDINPPSNLSSTSITTPTPYGQVSTSWESKEGSFELALSVPFNTQANFNLDRFKGYQIRIIKSGVEASNDEAVMDETLILGSGNYEIELSKTE